MGNQQAADNPPGKSERAWELMKDIGFAMLVTVDGDSLRSRPMAAHVDEEHGAIFFLTDARQQKDDEIKRSPSVNLAFANTSGQKYVSVSGTSEVSNDRALIRDLFNTPAKAWWDSADNPNIRVLKVHPAFAEYWDSPGSIVSYAKMAVAAVTGNRPDVGTNAKVTL